MMKTIKERWNKKYVLNCGTICKGEEPIKMDEYFMRKALEEAELAYREEEIPIGAVVVYKDKIIGRGHNKVEQDQNPLQHAELIAIKGASEAIGSWRLIDCDLYVTLEPCIMCSGALVYSRIRRVVFGAYDPKRGCCGSVMEIPQVKEFNHHVEIKGGVLKEECLEKIQRFFRELRAKKRP